jgi:3-dehydroquinate synthase
MSEITQLTVLVPSALAVGGGRESFHWARVRIGDDEADLSSEIFGQAHVYSILTHAFSAGLSRDVVWNFSGVEPAFLPSLRLAAKVYKRGVATRDDGADVTPPTIDKEAGNPLDNSTANAASSYVVKRVPVMAGCFEGMRENDFVVVDQRVSDLWRSELAPGFVSFDFAEARKDLLAVKALVKLFRERRLVGSRVFIVGGGVAGDVAGFAAGLLGLQCHYIPTTLLAMVDSSIGGKVGVNFVPWGKNQLGLFHSPAGVSIWSGWLRTLDVENFRSGLVEALKHALLSGRMDLWSSLIGIAKSSSVQDADHDPDRDPDQNSEIGSRLMEIVSIKRDVVSRDPFELGERVILNFGHTLGHAMESFAAKRDRAVTHGECVAVGMIHALRLSAKYGQMLDVDRFIRGLRAVTPHLRRLQSMFWTVEELPVVKDEIIALLSADKKSSGGAGAGHAPVVSAAQNAGSVSLILLTAPGKIARTPEGGWTQVMPMDVAWSDITDTWRFLGTST